MEFVGTNQNYAGHIPPGGEVVVEFNYYTRNIDLRGVGSFSAGFAVHYIDEISGTEQVNNISVRLPVLHSAQVAIGDRHMEWPISEHSSLDEFLSSHYVQVFSGLGFLVCFIGIGMIILFKLFKWKQVKG